ncbi:MAG: hypothetical protein O2856_19895 [Planctomycetota bacterium]|nr:hypothetical protein [Planctomycetota bacterium]
MFKISLNRFHEDEDGIEAIQVVMILAIAAVALLVIKSAWPTIRSWFDDALDELMRP